MPSPTARRVAASTTAQPRREGYRIFIDFDNTITMGDVLDGVIERFAADESWRTLEDAWVAGRIGARACLDGQLRCLRGTWPEFAHHLDGVVLDPGLKALQALLRHEQIELTIVSDNFDLFIAHILKRHGLSDVTFYANHLEWTGAGLLPSFPFQNSNCPDCAHCKKTHFLPPNADERQVIYIGDGRSDLCPARCADLVFAKANLLSCLRAENLPCVAFDRLADVARALPTFLHENKT